MYQHFAKRSEPVKAKGPFTMFVQMTKMSRRYDEIVSKMSKILDLRIPFLAGPSNDIGKNPTNLANNKKGFEAVKIFSMLMFGGSKKFC